MNLLLVVLALVDAAFALLIIPHVSCNNLILVPPFYLLYELHPLPLVLLLAGGFECELISSAFWKLQLTDGWVAIYWVGLHGERGQRV